MPWQVVMLFQNFLAAVFVINSRLIAKRFQRATVPLNLMIYLVIACTGLIYALVKGFNQVLPASFNHFIGWFIFAGISFAISNMLSYVVFQYVDAAVATLLSTLNIVAAVVLSTIKLHEGLKPLQIVGGLLLIGGVELILTIRVSHYEHKKLAEAVVLSVGAAIFFAFATTTEKYLLNHVNLPTYLVFGWGFQFIGVAVVSLVCALRIDTNLRLLGNRSFWVLALPASLLRMAGGILFVFSLKLANNLSVISVLTGLKVIMAAVLSVYILKERDYLFRKLEAALLAVGGIVLIYWR